MERVTVLGAGGHGYDVAAVLRACGLHLARFLDDGKVHLDPWSHVDGPYVFGVHDSLTRARRDFQQWPAVTLVHPSAYVEPDVRVGDGVVVGPRAAIGVGSSLGRHVHVGQMCSLVRTQVGDYATISPAAVVCGDVMVGEGAMIGAGAVVSNLCTIEPYATVGAGAVLPPGTVVPRGAVWAGVPARPLHEAAE